MLDAKFVRENPQVVREAMRTRGDGWSVDAFLELDGKRRALIGTVESLQARRNEASKAIGALMAQGQRDAAEEAKTAVREINDEIERYEGDMKLLDEKVREALSTAPNLPDASVVIGVDENDNPLPVLFIESFYEFHEHI
jgi:seryl-tRNA synthetase